MKKLLVSTMILAIAFGGAFAQKVAFKVKGSDTCLPLVQKEAEKYMKEHKNYAISVVGGGSGVGLSALIEGTTDIAMASRSMKMSEKTKMQESAKAYKEVTIAWDGIAVVVNPGNKVSQLTREQLEGIFTGKFKNWKEVGGDDLQIVVYSRESSSGTFEFFKEHVMLNKNYTASALMMPATGAIIQSVSQTKGAIGYVGLAYVEKEVKALKVSYNKGKTYVAPSMETAMNKTYPITRRLYFYYTSKVESKIKPFVDFMISAEGQAIVKQVGYVPLK
jgi:phosphate transport system substrate-binding protein